MHEKTIAEGRVFVLRFWDAKNAIFRCSLNLHIIAEAAQPVNFRFSAKPRHLALGVVAVRLLGSLKRPFASEFSAQELQRLLVAEGRERTGGIAVLFKEVLRLFD